MTELELKHSEKKFDLVCAQLMALFSFTSRPRLPTLSITINKMNTWRLTRALLSVVVFTCH